MHRFDIFCNSAAAQLCHLFLQQIHAATCSLFRFPFFRVAKLRITGRNALAITVGLIAATSIAVSPSATAQTRAPTTLYVSPSGDDSDGRTPATAFKNLYNVAAKTVPGDTVLVMNGTYTRSEFRDPAMYIGVSGTKDAYITFKAFPGHQPKLKSAGNVAGVVLDGVSFVVIDGLDIEGSRPDSDDIARPRICDAYNSSPIANDMQGSGIYIQSLSDNRKSNFPHHIVIRNSRIYNFGGSGIQSIRADYITIENNTVYGNAFYNPYAGSGISLYQQTDIDDVPDGQVLKNVIRGNVVYGNENRFGTAYAPGSTVCVPDAPKTDGNGIIFDDSRHTQSDDPVFKRAQYRGRTRIENNIAYDNGGRGINIYSSKYVEVVNNTTYRNATSGTNFSEVSSVDANDTYFFNNIFIAANDATPINSTGSGFPEDAGTVRYDNNLVFGSTKFDAQAGANNLVGRDPLFNDAAAADFKLRTGSPAIDAGIASTGGRAAPTADIAGTSRPQGNGVDIGAYESLPTTNTSLTNGLYKITNACNSRILGIQNGNPNPWDNVVIADAGTAGAVSWLLSVDGNGKYALRVPGTGSVMQAANAQTTSETNADLWSDWGGDVQRWTIADVGQGLFRITLAAASNLALDLKDAGNNGESNVWLYTDNGTCAQRWRFERQ